MNLPRFFKDTHFVVGTGKIFHNPWPQQFDRFRRVQTGDTACGSKRDECILPEPFLVDTQVTDNAINLINQAPKTKPWFALVGYHRPHWMYSTTQTSFDSIAGAVPGLAEQTRQAAAKGALDAPEYATNGIPPFASAVMRPSSGTGKSASINKATENRKWVFAATQWMDECLGRLMAGVASHLNNTIVILTSDNGVMMFDRAQSGKSVLFNSAKRVPLLIRHPDFIAAKGRRSGAMVELMDIFPTLAAMQDLNPPRGQAGTSLLPILRQMNTPYGAYGASLKLGAITIETRCTNDVLGKTAPNSWIACHQLSDHLPNRVEMFGVSIQTAQFNYIEWRVALWAAFSSRQPRWDTAGLWGRELYDFTGDDGLTRINGVEFEAQNLAPCPIACFPRSRAYRRIADNHDGNFRLPNDFDNVEYDPPDLQAVALEYRDVVRRLSVALRAIVRDAAPICSGHGTVNPQTYQCDQCISGWSGEQCEVPDFPEYADDRFPFPPTPLPTTSPTVSPTRSPTERPSLSPTPQSRAPSRWPTRLPPTRYPTYWTGRT